MRERQLNFDPAAKTSPVRHVTNTEILPSRTGKIRLCGSQMIDISVRFSLAIPSPCVFAPSRGLGRLLSVDHVSHTSPVASSSHTSVSRPLRGRMEHRKSTGWSRRRHFITRFGISDCSPVLQSPQMVRRRPVTQASRAGAAELALMAPRTNHAVGGEARHP